MQTATLTREAAVPAAMPAERMPLPFTWEVTASLNAARAEADGSIQILVSDPNGRPHRMLVTLPGDDAALCPTQAALWARARAARARFVASIVKPSFEGYTLLYGTARLTLALPSGAGGRWRHRPLLLDIEFLD
jgi:hypothetical protein